MNRFMNYKVDLHMHSTVSDGSDSPEEIAANVRAAGITVFSLTDHDAVKGCRTVRRILKKGDPSFICGVEFSCRDSQGQYHILGYAYDLESEYIHNTVEKGHSLRMKKVTARLDFIKNEFGFDFPEDEIKKLLAMDNPGKPHIGNLMVKYGYADTKEIAIKEYINRLHLHSEYVRPEEAIEGISRAGGIPVLAHPFFGSGDQLIMGEEMEKRLERLVGYGLQGVEALYSGFTPKLISQMIAYADRYDLYVTAGSDYHGTNKMIELGDTGFDENMPVPARLEKFLRAALA